MRDLVLAVILFGGSIYTLRQPWVGVILWTWVSLMNPHELSWRLQTFPVAMMVAGATLLGIVFTRDRHNPFVGAPTVALAAFTVWICVTLPFSIYFDESLELWIRSMKIFFMIYVTLALIDNRRKLDLFIAIAVFSLGFYGVKGGIFTIATAGSYKVWGPGGFVAGNNEIALATVMIIPLMRYLHMQLKNVWARRAMVAAMALSAVTVLGTYSRGAFLAIGAMALFLWVKGSQKFAWGLTLIVVGVAALSFMPEQWWERMGTIQTYDQDDSALGRINAWWNAVNLAKDRVFGGGFMIYYPDVFARYAPNPEDVHAAHSIYFQVLGEHGFIGLALFLLVGITTWHTAGRLVAAGKRSAEDRWAGELGAMVQVSMVGYAVGGAFLSLAYFDLPYDIMVAAVLALHFVRRRVPVPEKFPYRTPPAPRLAAQPAAVGGP